MSPEKVASLCKPESLPSDFTTILQIYTKQGLRVIAAATKTLNTNVGWSEINELSRGELEEKCEFLGLIIMQNLVKAETYPALEKPFQANIETVMVTGDNILAAISVAQDCKLLQPDTTVVKVEAQHLDGQLNVSYTVQDDTEKEVIICF